MALARNPFGRNSPLMNSQYQQLFSSFFEGGWKRWNGSGDIPFSSLGTSYYSTNNSIATIAIDAERWLLVAGSDSPTVRVGKLVDGLPVYGTPVALDATINGAAWFRGVQITSFKVYINYCWYNGTQNVNYAKICNIDPDDNITFGTRSAQIGASAPGSSAIATTVVRSAEGHPVHGYYASDTGAYSLRTTTVNVDDTITINAEKNLGMNGFFGSLTCENPNYLFLLLDNAFYALEISETVIGNVIDTIDVYDLVNVGNLSSSVASVDLTRSIVLYQRLSSGNSIVGTRIVTFDENSLTLSLGSEVTFADALYAGELIRTANSQGQLLATMIFKTPSSEYANSFASCLTPNGTELSSARLYPINANWYDLDVFVSPYNTQSTALNTTTIIAPFVTYDGVSYGATILIRKNALDANEEVFRLEAKNATTTTQPSLGGAVSTLGSTLIAIVSPNNYESILLPGTKLIVSGSIYTVVTAAFVGAETLVDVVETTPPYSFIPCSLLGVTAWANNGVTYSSVGGAQIPSLGEINGKPSVICYSTNNNAYLESALFDFPMSVDATLFLVCKTFGTSDVLCSFKSANLTPLADVTSETVLVYPPNTTVGNYDLTSELSLISFVRQNGNTRVYINGILNETLTDEYSVLAIGNPVQGRIGNNFAGTNYFKGYISAISLWYGALTDTARQSQEAYYFAEYDISPPEFGFSLLGGGTFDLLSGQTFDLLGS